MESKTTIEPGLDAVTDALNKVGNPHLNLQFIHVAGTNGKGSTIAFIQAILETAGLKVHVYTSPHLIEYNERIVLDGSRPVSDNL